MKEVLRAHNRHRCFHGARPLVWDSEVESSARDAARRLGGPTGQDDLIINGEQCGENMYYGDGFGEEAVNQWYDQVASTDNGLVDAYSQANGAYTQIVWTSTSRLGCWRAVDTNSGENNIVCHYCVGGNLDGQFRWQVSQFDLEREYQCAREDGLISGAARLWPTIYIAMAPTLATVALTIAGAGPATFAV